MLCPQYIRCKKLFEQPLSLRKSIKAKLHPYFLIILVFVLSKMELSFITGRKRGCNAVYDGHVNIFDRKKDSGVMHWQCKGKRTLQCKARLYTQEKTSVIRVTEHSHPSSRTRIEKVMAMSKIKNDGGTKLPGQVVRDVLVGTNDEVKAALPTCTNLKAQVRRFRKKINNVPANPQSAALLQIPPDYCTTTNGDEFVLQSIHTEAEMKQLQFCSRQLLEKRRIKDIERDDLIFSLIRSYRLWH